MFEGLGLAALKDDAMEVGAAGLGTLVGVGVAKFVTDKVGGMLVKKEDKTKDLFPGAQAVNALIPVAVGVAIYSMGAQKMGRGAARDAVSGVAAGMVAFGVGKLVASFSKEAGKATGLSLGLAGVYDYSLDGFGPGDVSAYMMNGAPVSFELQGAPVDIQSLNGAPTSATVISTSPSMATTLVA